VETTPNWCYNRAVRTHTDVGAAAEKHHVLRGAAYFGLVTDPDVSFAGGRIGRFLAWSRTSGSESQMFVTRHVPCHPAGGASGHVSRQMSGLEPTAYVVYSDDCLLA
jgi:hypothetical protein